SRLLGLHGHLQGRGCAERPLGVGRGSLAPVARVGDGGRLEGEPRRMRGRVAMVTGAKGFAGSWLARALLAAGAGVVGYDRGDPALSGLELQGIADEVEVVTGDLTDADLIGRTIAGRGVDAVFHLAAQTIVGRANASPVPTFETNI